MKTNLCHAIRLGLRLLLFSLALAPALGLAQTSQYMSYQGYLTDGNGIALGSTNTGPKAYDVVFRIWDAATGGNELFSELQTVTVDNGYFSVLLGQGTAYSLEPTLHVPLANVFTNSAALSRYVEMTVLGIGVNGFITILPRLQLVSSPFAFQAATALSVSGNNVITPANLATNIGVWQTAGTNISYGLGNVTVSGGTFAGSGAGLSNLNASALSAGTIPDARQSTNVALLNGSQTFSGNPTFSGSVTLNGTPTFYNGLTVWGGAINPNSGGAVIINGSVYSGGTYSGFYAYDRGSSSSFWTFYSLGGRCEFYRSGLSDLVAIDTGGNVIAHGSFYANSSPDLAETIPAAAEVEAGDIVCADPNKAESVIRCGKSAHAMLGVISDGSGGFMINSRAKTTDSPLTGAPLVLVGRVPVKVSLEGGAVKIGDYLAPSSVPGVAMRSAESDGTIGLALAAFDGADAANGVGKVLCFVKVTQRDSEIESLKETIAELKADIQALRQSSGRVQDNSTK